MPTTTLTKSIFFAAPPEAVWPFLVDKDKLGEWYHPAEQDLAPGQSYTLTEEGRPIVWGKVQEMDAPHRLVTTFVIGPFGDAETLLTWALEPAAGGTRLTLTHEGIEAAAGHAAMQMLQALDNGWDKHFARLRTASA